MRMVRPLGIVILGFVLVAFFLNSRATAQKPGSDEIPKVLLAGMDAYKSDGPEAAIKAWLKGSPIEGSKDALSQANVMRQVQDYYGTFKTFELISSRSLSPSNRIFYFSLNYEKGPLFAKFLAYRSQDGWIVVSFNFNTKEEVIIPSNL